MRKQLLITILFALFFVTINAQEKPKWSISAGWNIVDIRTPEKFSEIMKDYFNGSIQDLNALSYPSRIAIERALNDNFSLQLSGSYNNVQKGFNYKESDPLIDREFIYGDLKLKYDLNHLFGDTGWFDPFIFPGLGYSKIGSLSDLKVVAGYGFNIWLTDNWGINLESSYNHNFSDTFPDYKGTGTDFFQHNAGISYRFGKSQVKDRDGDGIIDRKDKCPDEYGVVELEGCPKPIIDTDNDGVFDNEDRCPEVAGTLENKGCPEVDSDGDGIMDHKDKCPQVKGVSWEQGCPEKDSDKDGIVDSKDRCPDKFGVAANEGCPEDPKTTVKTSVLDETAIIEKIKSHIIYFDFDSAVIESSEAQKLDEVYSSIQSLKNTYTFIVEGNTDIIGTESYNKALGESRSKAVVDYLVKKGLSRSIFEDISFGKSNPASINNNDLNRRVEIRVR